ncbi:C-X-C motif chemokine 10-like [Discoglossus pictus]
MESRCVLIMCVLIISATLIQGLSLPRADRCLCRKLLKNINVKAIAKLEVFPISSTCEKVEIVATMKGSKKTKCLNPKAKVIKTLISDHNRRQKAIQETNQA